MPALLIAYIASAVGFVALDLAWLTLAGPRVYRPVIGPLLADTVKLPAALAFYALYVGGLVYFAARPALAAHRWTLAAQNGAVLGLIAYATYDLTNQATLRLWSTRLTITDLCWGMVASAAASSLGYAMASRLSIGGR